MGKYSIFDCVQLRLHCCSWHLAGPLLIRHNQINWLSHYIINNSLISAFQSGFFLWIFRGKPLSVLSPVCHVSLPPEYEEHVDAAGPGADGPPVLLHPDPDHGVLEILTKLRRKLKLCRSQLIFHSAQRSLAALPTHNSHIFWQQELGDFGWEIWKWSEMKIRLADSRIF